MKQVIKADADENIRQCWEVVVSLRPHLQEQDFLQKTKSMMDEGYNIVFIEEEGKAVAFAGFRRMQMFYCGNIIYIDDLNTLPEYRNHGYAGILLDFIHDIAAKENRDAVHLDSGYHRWDAHRLYLKKGYVLGSHHFVKQLK
jgi:GNAT superfamily N-acetyltransferase